MEFSIIVPVYNVEKYIKKCLNSVITQMHKDYELIIIDDGSPDSSIAIAESIIRDMNHCRIIHQENKGLGGARNTGVKHAKGEFIFFLDSDDYLEENTLLELHHIIDKFGKIDIIAFNINEVDEAGTILNKTDYFRECGGNVQKNLFITSPSASNKVFRREFYSSCNVAFPEHMLYEDTASIRKLIVQANQITISDQCLYNYVQRQGSITHSCISRKYLDIVTQIDDLLRFLQSQGLFEQYSYECECVAARSILLFQTRKINEQDPHHEMQNELVDYIRSKYKRCYRNSYLSMSEQFFSFLLINRKYFLFFLVNKVRKKWMWLRKL